MYQISCNVSGVLIVFPLTLFTGASPLLPVHILLLNLISETGPCIALGLEKPEEGIMYRKPRKRSEGLLNRERWGKILREAVILAVAGIAAYVVARRIDPLAVTSAVLATAFLSRVWQSLSARSETVTFFSRALRPNPGLMYTVIGTLVFLALSLYTSAGNVITKTVPLSLPLLFACLGLSLVPFVVIESVKLVRSRMS